MYLLKGLLLQLLYSVVKDFLCFLFFTGISPKIHCPIYQGRILLLVLVGRPEGKGPLGRTRRRWEDNIKMDLREIGIDGANWIKLAQDRVKWRAFVNTVMNLRVP
jgi:hypothetical protein